MHVLQIDLAALLLADARRVDGLGRVEVGAFVQAAEEPLEQCRLPHHDVDEVDASMGRVTAARDGDQWRDGMGGVREEDVLAGRDDQQRDRGREQQEPERQDAAGSQPALHRSDREMPPSTCTVVPVTYPARAEARKQTTSPNSRGVPMRPIGICASSAAGGPSAP